MARRVHGERSVGLLYGQRALLIGALEPLTYTGTMLSTDGRRPSLHPPRPHREDPGDGLPRDQGRGRQGARRGPPPARADQGRAAEAAGSHPAGSAYSAFDPELMLWTLAVIADSGRAMYEAMVRPLREKEREALWQDYVHFGELFGLPRSEVPGSYREFDSWWQGKLASPDLHATEHALEMAPLVAFRQPVPLPARINLETQNLIIKGTLPRARPRDLRHPLVARPRGLLPLDNRRPSPRPPRLSPPPAARPQRLLLRLRDQGREAARRHPHSQHRRLSLG